MKMWKKKESREEERGKKIEIRGLFVAERGDKLKRSKGFTTRLDASFAFSSVLFPKAPLRISCSFIPFSFDFVTYFFLPSHSKKKP